MHAEPRAVRHRVDTRLATFRFPIVGWKPHKVVQHDGDDIHLYIVPERWPAPRD